MSLTSGGRGTAVQGTACEAASSSQGLLAEGLPRQERVLKGTARLSPNQATAPGLETAWGSARLLQGCSGLHAGKEELAG